MKLNDKVAIVTGAASGLGKEIALTYAREGAKVAIADMNKDAADAAANEIRAGGGQSARHFEIAFPRRKHQRCQPTTGQFVHGLIRLGRFWRRAFKTTSMRRRNKVRTGIDVGAFGDEHLYRIEMALGNGPHQRRRATPGLDGVDPRSIVQKDLDRIALAGAGSEHDGSVFKFR